jgi:hypothetical protein
VTYNVPVIRSQDLLLDVLFDYISMEDDLREADPY